RELLSDGAGTERKPPALPIRLRSRLQLIEIESVVLKERIVLGHEDGMDEIGRNLVESSPNHHRMRLLSFFSHLIFPIRSNGGGGGIHEPEIGRVRKPEEIPRRRQEQERRGRRDPQNSFHIGTWYEKCGPVIDFAPQPRLNRRHLMAKKENLVVSSKV